MTQEVKSNYKCSQLELYAVLLIGWQSYQNYLAEFTGFRAFYTQLYGDDAVAQVNAAQQMPDYQERNEVAESLRIVLAGLSDNSLNNWQKLKRYITFAYETNLHKPKLEAAGSTLYREASNNDWEVVKGLMVSGLNFIQNNDAQLKANLNMPLTFEADYTAAKVQFETTYLQFIQAEESAMTLAADKIRANNAIYEKLIIMFKDGFLLFEQTPEIQKQFVFDTVLELVSGGGDPQPEPEDEIILTTDQNTIKQLNFIIKGIAGTKGAYDMGDGTVKKILHTGNPIAISHTYATTGNYDIKYWGEIESLTEFQAINCSITSVELPDTLVELDTLNFYKNKLTNITLPSNIYKIRIVSLADNNLVEASVNGALITVNNLGTTAPPGGAQMSLHQGNNAPPTGDGEAARAALVNRGWTIIVNPAPLP